MSLTVDVVYIYMPGSSKCVKFVPFHPKNKPKGRHFTYLEDPGISYTHICIYLWGIMGVSPTHDASEIIICSFL